jgi:hypothetical protein
MTSHPILHVFSYVEDKGETNVLAVVCRQGDQTGLRKKSPKMSPKPLLSKLLHGLTVKRSSQELWATSAASQKSSE